MMARAAVAFAACLAVAEGFAPRLNRRQARSALAAYAEDYAPVAEGLHGTGSRFLPLQQMTQKDWLPRIVRIAGAYPGLTSAEVRAVAPVPEQDIGSWVYDFTDEAANALGVVACPGCEAVNDSIDPVAVIATAESLGIQLKEEAEVVAIIDRGDTAFNSNKFFAFTNPETDELSICWQKEQPQGWPIAGRLTFVMVPFLESLAVKSTGFDEVDNEF